MDILAGVEWRSVANSPSSSGLPYATHQAVLDIPGVPRMRVYRLNTGQAIVHADDLKAFLSFMEIDGAEQARLHDGPQPTGATSAAGTDITSDGNHTRAA